MLRHCCLECSSLLTCGWGLVQMLLFAHKTAGSFWQQFARTPALCNWGPVDRSATFQSFFAVQLLQLACALASHWLSGTGRHRDVMAVRSVVVGPVPLWAASAAVCISGGRLSNATSLPRLMLSKCWSPAGSSVTPSGFTILHSFAALPIMLCF